MIDLTKFTPREIKQITDAIESPFFEDDDASDYDEIIDQDDRYLYKEKRRGNLILCYTIEK